MFNRPRKDYLELMYEKSCRKRYKRWKGTPINYKEGEPLWQASMMLMIQVQTLKWKNQQLSRSWGGNTIWDIMADF